MEVGKFTVGDPFAETSKLGPLVSSLQRERVRSYIRKGIEEGAELLCGGPEAPDNLPVGWYVKPTVFGRVDPEATIAQEEIFGPVLSIITYKDEEDAVRIANNSIYGLSGGVWSQDEARAVRLREACVPAKSISTAARSTSRPPSAGTSSPGTVGKTAAPAWKSISSISRCNSNRNVRPDAHGELLPDRGEQLPPSYRQALYFGRSIIMFRPGAMTKVNCAKETVIPGRSQTVRIGWRQNRH